LKRQFSCLLGALAALLGPVASAADCRTAVRALLVQSEPDPDAVTAARALCGRASEQGDPLATYHLALLDLGPDGWQPDRAAALITSAAEEGVPEAQYWLAWQFDAGPLLPNDPAAARHWYEAAASQSHRLALLRLAELYERGELGAPVQPELAAEFRQRGAQCPANPQ
jgi:TPR repeat protein